MELKIKFVGNYDIKDHKLVRSESKKGLKTTIRYSEEMGMVYFRFETKESYAITHAVDVVPDFSLSLAQAKESFKDNVIDALTKSTWEGDCPLHKLDRKFLAGTAAYFAEVIFEKLAKEEIDCI